MAVAVAVRSHCEDSRDNGYLQQKIPQQRIGLDDDEVNAGCGMLTMRRCASSCMKRDLALEITTPLSNQVCKQSASSPGYPELSSITIRTIAK